MSFLAENGHKVNKNKLQLWKTEVKYLGHNIAENGRAVDGETKSAILQAPKPQTKKQMMSFLRMVNYCRAWIPNYAEITGPLTKMIYAEPLTMSDKIEWTPTAEEAFVNIKKTLVGSAVLALPNYQKEFIQTVDCKKDYMTSVLLQIHGDKMRPIAYYSSKLDPVAAALPVCVRAVVAASMAIQSSATVVLFHPLRLLVPHAVCSVSFCSQGICHVWLHYSHNHM